MGMTNYPYQNTRGIRTVSHYVYDMNQNGSGVIIEFMHCLYCGGISDRFIF